MKSQVITGNNIDTLSEYPDNYFDSVVTDPPYGIEFLAKEWDSNTGAIETWQQVFRVLKPGGYLLAFSAARTYHKLATNIESVGFDIRDQIMWLYGSGFPKAQDMGKAIEKREGKKHKSYEYHEEADGSEVESAGAAKVIRCVVCKSSTGPIHKYCYRDDCPKPWIKPQADNQWAGWRTALKPAHEPIVMARKPFKGSCVDNVLKHGVGALNIDATRIPSEERKVFAPRAGTFQCVENSHSDTVATAENMEYRSYGDRFPSNVIGEISDEYQKYFYCPKVSRAERHIGFESAPSSEKMLEEMGGYFLDSEGNRVAYEHRHNVGMVYLPHIGSTIPARHMYEAYTQWSKSKSTGNNHPLAHIPKNPDGMYDEGYYDKVRSASAGNHHPTVKPVALMRYLVKLVTPPGGKVLDPFTGSGSTGMAVVELGNEFTGCELDPDYVDIATKRIQAWYDHTDSSGKDLPPEWFNEVN